MDSGRSQPVTAASLWPPAPGVTVAGLRRVTPRKAMQTWAGVALGPELVGGCLRSLCPAQGAGGAAPGEEAGQFRDPFCWGASAPTPNSPPTSRPSCPSGPPQGLGTLRSPAQNTVPQTCCRSLSLLHELLCKHHFLRGLRCPPRCLIPSQGHILPWDSCHHLTRHTLALGGQSPRVTPQSPVRPHVNPLTPFPETPSPRRPQTARQRPEGFPARVCVCSR